MENKKYKIIFTPIAKIEIQNAIYFYNNKQHGLGRKFYNELKNTTKLILANPYLQILFKEYRGLIIKKFPFYQIVYFIDEIENIIYVISVFHTSQNPIKKINYEI